MKKLYLLLLALLLIPTTSAVTPYGLDQPVHELNGYSLREVFENRNMTMPYLTGITEISVGVYRISQGVEYSLDYDTLNTEWILNGNITTNTFINNILGKTFNNLITNTFTYIYVSGTITSTSALHWIGWNTPRHSVLLSYINNSITSINNSNNNITIGMYLGDVYANLRFKIQLEKGSTATPYQVPTSGPYSEFDFGALDLTPKQIDMYYYYYLEAVQSENTSGTEFFLISIFFMYILIMVVGCFTKVKYFYFAGSLLWLVPIFNYQNIFIITTSIIVFLIHLVIIFYSDKDDVFE